MNFILLGFSQDKNVRNFRFEAIADDRSRRSIVVAADLPVARRYSIPTQELPLICRRLLETTPQGDASASMVLTEADMRRYAGERQAVIDMNALKRKPHRPHVTRPDSAANAPAVAPRAAAAAASPQNIWTTPTRRTW